MVCTLWPRSWAIDFHFYEDSRAMPSVADWIRLRTAENGYSPGLVTNELGQRGPDTALGGNSKSAWEVFTKMIMALALGVEKVVWFSADSIGTGAPWPDKVG